MFFKKKYFLWWNSAITSSGRLSTCPSGPVIPSARICLCSCKIIHKHCDPEWKWLHRWIDDTWSFGLLVLLPLQWCHHSQHAPEQSLQGLWWHQTPHRSKRMTITLGNHLSKIHQTSLDKEHSKMCRAAGHTWESESWKTSLKAK